MADEKIRVKMKVICDHCGDEMEIWVDPDNLEIDPPYFCDPCERALLCEEPEMDEFDYTDSFEDDMDRIGDD